MVYPAFFLLASNGISLLAYWQLGLGRSKMALALYLLQGWTLVYLAGMYGFDLSASWWSILWALGSWAILLLGASVSVWQAVLIAIPPFILAFIFPEPVELSLSWGIVTAVPVALLLRQTTLTSVDQPAPSSPSARENTAGDGSTYSPQMQEILNALTEGVVVGDEHGRVIYVNQVAAHIIGTDAHELIDQFMMDILAHLPMITPHSQDNAEREAQTQFEMNGRLIQGYMSIVYSAGRTLQASVAILRDVTDSHQSQRTKTAFLTNISHELRTPLTAIKGYVELLESETAGQLNAQQKMFVEVIHRNVSRVVQLINSLIFISSVKGGSPKPRGAYADLRQLVNQIVRELTPLAVRAQQEIILSIDPQLTPIQADSIHIATILQELLNNSIKFNQPDGKIWVSVAREQDDSGADFTVVQIRDEGIGIAPADQLHIFDEFYRASTEENDNQSGMGVGLAIVRALVEAYNGRIWIDSDLGEGSTFTLILPTRQSEANIIPLPTTAEEFSEV